MRVDKNNQNMWGLTGMSNEQKEKGATQSNAEREEAAAVERVLPSPRVTSAAKPTTEALHELEGLMTEGVGSLRDRLAQGKAERERRRKEQIAKGEDTPQEERAPVGSWEEHMQAREASLRARTEREEERKREAAVAKAGEEGGENDSDSAIECDVDDDFFDPRWNEF